MEKTQFAVRFDPALLTEIDDRAKTAGLSRNEWLERSSRWIIHNLPLGADGPTRRAAAHTAPPDITGTHAVDMGLDNPEQK